jgi:hypothetical protein
MKLIFTPAECYSGCEDKNCPYTHRDMWQYVNKDGSLSDGFDSEAEATIASLAEREE